MSFSEIILAKATSKDGVESILKNGFQTQEKHISSTKTFEKHAETDTDQMYGAGLYFSIAYSMDQVKSNCGKYADTWGSEIILATLNGKYKILNTAFSMPENHPIWSASTAGRAGIYNQLVNLGIINLFPDYKDGDTHFPPEYGYKISHSIDAWVHEHNQIAHIVVYNPKILKYVTSFECKKEEKQFKVLQPAEKKEQPKIDLLQQAAQRRKEKEALSLKVPKASNDLNLENNFKAWLESIEDYEPFRSKIDKIGANRTFPFEKWFSNAENGRIYIPLSEVQEEDIKSTKYLRDYLESRGYQIIDLKKGYAKQNNKQNIFKIGKLLDTLLYKDLKLLDIELQDNKISLLKYNKEKLNMNRDHTSMKTKFENLNSRVSGVLYVVISSNIHDLASMSTGRGWSSCMNLDGGEKKDDVYCEVERGGFVAYVIKDNDREIQQPIARLHIRRFDSKKGLSIAVPEETIYGKEINGFIEKVKDWIQSKQGSKAGRYRKVGGNYSDTFSSSNNILISPKEGNKIRQWLTKWLDIKQEDKSKYADYFSKSLISLFNSSEKYPDKFLNRLKEYIFNSNIWYKPTKGFAQTTDQFMSKFAIRFPDLISKDDFFKAYAKNINSEGGIGKQLLEKFPQYIDEKILSITSNRNKSAVIQSAPHLSPVHKEIIEDELDNKLTISNPDFTPSNKNGIYQVRNYIHNEIEKLSIWKPIPERIASKAIKFAEDIMRKDFDEEKEGSKDDKDLITDFKRLKISPSDFEEMKESVIESLLHVFTQTKTDVPVVQKFYKSLLPNWEKYGGIGIIGYAISSLRENGRQFLPFIKQKKQDFIRENSIGTPESELHQGYKGLTPLTNSEYARIAKDKDEVVESFNYVIDTLETGSPSKKYSMKFGVNYDNYMHRQKRRTTN